MPLPTDIRRARRAAGQEMPPGLRGAEILLPAIIKRIPRLDIRARRMVDGLLAGLHRSPGRGFSAEFSEHRKFVPGDDPRHVDWRVYAKSDRLYVKQFHAETSLRATLLVDASASMAFGGSDRSMSKIEYAVTLAAAMAMLLLRQNDRVGLATFGSPPDVMLQPRGARSHLRRILCILSRLHPAGASALPDAISRLGDRLRRRGMVAVFSDVFCDPKLLAESLKYLASRKQDLVLFEILDRAEFSLPESAGVEAILRDPESGRAFPAGGNMMAAVYRERLARHIESVKTCCGDVGADFCLAVTDEPFDRPLLRFLAARKRML